jgi:hypothetical protein
MRVPRRQAGTALLIAALLLAALAASLRFFVASSAPAAGAPTAGLTPAARGVAGGPAHGVSGQPAPGTSSRVRASAAVAVPPAVTVSGAAALPSARVHPGYASPEDAVDGFYLALLSGTPTRACAFATTPCPSFGPSRITGRVTVIDAVSHDGEALVEVTGTICVSASCWPLTDRVVMPAGPASFAASWAGLTGGVYGWAGSPLPCVQDPATGQWRVKLR